MKTHLRGHSKRNMWGFKMRGASAAKNSARNARKITSEEENIFAMSLMTKLTLALTLTMMRKCYSVSRSPINEIMIVYAKVGLFSALELSLNLLLRRKIPPQKV